MRKLSFSDADKKQDKLLLVIDSAGVIGNALLEGLGGLKNPVSVVFATAQTASSEEENIHNIIYKKKLPMFPNADYIAIVLAYNGESELLEAAGSFLKKTEETKGRCVLVVPWEWRSNKEVLKTIEKHNDLFVVFVGEIFGDEYRDVKTTVGRFFKEAQRNKQLVVSGMGLTSTYPVFLEDVVSGIVEVALGNIKGKVFLLFPKYPPTKLGLARMFQKIDPLIKIDMTKEKKQNEEIAVVADGTYLLSHTYMIESKIRDVYRSLEETQEQVANVSSIIEQRKRGNSGAFIWFCIFFTCCLLLMPLLVTLLFSFVGVQALRNGEGLLKTNKILQAREKAKDAVALFSISLKTSDMLVYEASFIGQTKRATSIRNIALTGFMTSKAMVAITSAAESIENTDGAQLASSLRNTLVLLDEASMEKEQSIKLPAFPFAYIKNTVDILPEVLGFQKEQTYLVLLQNNMELRPGGGFIGSYAIAKVKNGAVTDFSIHDVYDADGQLKGHVEPPFAIRRYFQSVHWYLRDSNFDIDFPKSASASAFFLEKETGIVVDGVIAVDVSFVRSLVSVLGSIHLPDYNETLTADNFYPLVQKYAQDNSFPGSRQKKDILVAVFIAIKTRLEMGNVPYAALLKTLQKGIDQKHVLFAFSNPAVQNVFDVNNMSSSMQSLEMQSIPIGAEESKVKDFLGINEANLGVNKANYHLVRKVKQEVVISKEGKITDTVAIHYSNVGKEDYKSYLRFVLPRGAKISKISIDNAVQKIVPAVINPTVYEAKRFIAPKGLEVEQKEEGNKMIFGMLLVVPKKTVKTITISYTITQIFSATASSLFYELFYFKQPGTDTYPYNLSISYPDTLKPLNAEDVISPLVFSEDLTTDKQYVTHFSRE